MTNKQSTSANLHSDNNKNTIKTFSPLQVFLPLNIDRQFELAELVCCVEAVHNYKDMLHGEYFISSVRLLFIHIHTRSRY